MSGAALEVSLVSALREVIVEGVLEIPLSQLLGVCTFLAILGGLLYLRVWMFTRFNLVNQMDFKNIEKTGDLETNHHSFSREHYPI